jgi:hypothetical protein
MPCISRYPLNRNNFIRWYKATTLSVSDLASEVAVCDDEVTRLPNNFRLINGRKSLPKLLMTFEWSFYANLTDTISDADFANWTLTFVNPQGTKVLDGTFSVTKDGTTNYRFYASGTISDGAVTPGIYRMVLYNNTNDAVRYISNWLEILDKDKKTDYVSLSYRSSIDRDYFNYEGLGSFRNKVFHEFYIRDVQLEITRENYIQAGNGKVRTDKTEERKYVELQSYYFDDFDHEATESMLLHDDLLFNSETYEVKEDYSRSYNVQSEIYVGSFQLYIDFFSQTNLNGYTPPS